MALQIVKYPDPVLTEMCKEVQNFDTELGKTLDDMFEAMYRAHGVGLAAPQVGILKRFTVIDCSDDNSEQLELVNPVIIEVEGTELSEEGCLSIPGYQANVKRNSWVKVNYFDRKGEEHELEAEGLLSVAIQHEIDHLDGVLFIDKLSRLKRESFKRWFKKKEQ